MISIENAELNYIAQNTNMEISNVSFARLDTEWRYDDAVSNSTRVYIPTLGEGILESRNEKVSIVPGKIYIIPSMLNFSYRCENRLEKFFVHVSIEKLGGFDVLRGVNKILVLEDQGECEKFRQIFNEAGIEAALKMKLMVFSIIMRGISEYKISLGKPEECSPLTRYAIEYIGKHLSAKLKVSEIADALFVSRLTLSNTFSRDMKISIGKYIDERLMLVGEQELMSGNLTINEISEKLGFCDRFYFTRKFTEKFGKAPKQYVKANKYLLT